MRNRDVGIISLSFNNNIGGQIQGYALQQVIKSLGYTPYSISCNRGNLPFVEKFINVIPIKDKKDPSEYYRVIKEQNLDTIVVGSDQVWRPIWMPADCSFLPKIGTEEVSIFSYAASFGVPEWQWEGEETEVIKESLSRFKDVSVRELDAIQLIKDKTGVDARYACDPTLLLSKEHYISMCEDKRKKDGGIFTYILDPSLDKESIVRKAKEYTKQNIIQIIDKNDVIEWLSCFRDCSCVITDSFHGCLFSIIFNKPFICLGNDIRGGSRFQTLSRIFNISNRMSSNLKQLTISPNIDYSDLVSMGINYIRTNLDRSKFLRKRENIDKQSSENKYRAVICAIAKNENNYINEWVNWHLDRGFDHIFLFDNNNSDSKFIGNFIERSDKVTIYNVNDFKEKALQLRCYNAFYNSSGEKFDWCLFSDIDEFIDGIEDINEFLKDRRFEYFDQIRIKWRMFSDGGLIDRDVSRPVVEDFTEISTAVKPWLTRQGKSIVRGGIKNFNMCSCHFGAIGSVDWEAEDLSRRDFTKLKPVSSCLPSGIPCKSMIDMVDDYSNETVFINHYMTKSLKEFIDQKIGRGDACFDNRNLNFDYYWRVNEKTQEKLEYIEEFKNNIYEVKKIHAIMPTCSPNEFFNKMAKGLDSFIGVRDRLTFGVIFQEPYTRDQIELAVNEFKRRGIEVLYDFKKYDGSMERTPLISIRNDAAILNKSADYYLNVDDDMLYTCEPHELRDVLFNALKFAEENNAGTIILGYPSHEDPYKEIRNDGEFHIKSGDAWASMGMLLKNIYANGNIVPSDALKCLGGNDDVLMADCRKYINGLGTYYYGVALGHHTDIKETSQRSMNRLKFKEFSDIDGTCRRYINNLRRNIPIENSFIKRGLKEIIRDIGNIDDKIILLSKKGDFSPSKDDLDSLAGIGLSDGIKKKSYVAVVDKKKGVVREIPSDDVCAYIYKLEKSRIKLLSYNKERISFIRLDDKDISCGGRGLNIVVLDRKNLNVLNSLCIEN